LIALVVGEAPGEEPIDQRLDELAWVTAWVTADGGHMISGEREGATKKPRQATAKP
jgi:hypothetical protein